MAEDSSDILQAMVSVVGYYGCPGSREWKHLGTNHIWKSEQSMLLELEFCDYHCIIKVTLFSFIIKYGKVSTICNHVSHAGYRVNT